MRLQTRFPKFQALVMLCLAMIAISLPLQAAQAQSSYPNGLIPAGETVQGSVFLYAPQVTIDGTVDGDVFAISQNVTLTGEIKGSLFILSTAATIDGQLAGDLYTANSRLTLGPTASVGRSIYAAAGMIAMQSGSQVARDLYLIALSGQLSGSIGRYTRAHLGFLELLVLLFGDDGLLRPVLPPSFRLPLSALDTLALHPTERALHWPSSASAAWLPALALRLAFEPQLQTAPINSLEIGNWLLARLRVFAPLFLIGLILIWLFPRFLQGSTEQLRSRPLGSFGVGVVTFFVGYGIAGLALALVVALGLFFASIRYWDLALITWGAGLGGLGLAMAFFGLAIIYLSKILVAYLFGTILLGRLPAATWGRRIWMLLLGLTIGVLLLAVPILGWVLSVLATMFGLGAIYLHLRQPRPPDTSSIIGQPTPTIADQIEPVMPVEIPLPLEDRGEIEQEFLVATPSEDLISEGATVADIELPIETSLESAAELDAVEDVVPEFAGTSAPDAPQIGDTPEAIAEVAAAATDLATEELEAVSEVIESKEEATSESVAATSSENPSGDGNAPLPKRPRRQKSS